MKNVKNVVNEANAGDQHSLFFLQCKGESFWEYARIPDFQTPQTLFL